MSTIARRTYVKTKGEKRETEHKKDDKVTTYSTSAEKRRLRRFALDFSATVSTYIFNK